MLEMSFSRIATKAYTHGLVCHRKIIGLRCSFPSSKLASLKELVNKAYKDLNLDDGDDNEELLEEEEKSA